MKNPILTTLSVLATSFILFTPICNADTPAQQHEQDEQAAINDNTVMNNLSDPSNVDQNYSPSVNGNDDANNDDADNGDSSSNSDDGND